MFEALRNHAPRFETRRALLVLNMQNDTFKADDFEMCNDTDFIERLKAAVPAFRRLEGDIVWVKTEVQGGDDGQNRDPDRDTNTASSSSSAASQEPLSRLGLENYFPSSRARAKKKGRGPGGGIPRNNDDLVDHENDALSKDMEDYLAKPRKGQPPQLFTAGTPGAALRDDMLPLVDGSSDITITKSHYSAFDATPLLMSLRMRLVTHIYLCGCFTNVSIYATAADAVRHGFEVTVVEDCMGYRSARRHLDAMRKMADFLGVSGTDSEEIVAEANVKLPPPDADESMFSGPGLEGIEAQQAIATAGPSTQDEEAMDIDATTAGNPGFTGHEVSSTGADADERPGVHEPRETSSAEVDERTVDPHEPKLDSKQVCFPGDHIGEGDSDILYDALSASLSTKTFELIREEVGWHAMHHRGGEVPRRVAVEGDVAPDGSVPVYRHPADESPPLLPWSKTIRKIRDEVQLILKQPFNHALIQLYRDGQDNISEHSDKTLDIVRGSNIINVSLGAQRTMVLRTKKQPASSSRESGGSLARQIQRVPLPHNSIFVLGFRTNAKWLHGIRPDKRREVEKSDAERAFGGERISITFRNIGTYMSADKSKIWGQGAVSKYQATAGSVNTSDGGQLDAMIFAFGKENQQSEFDWDAEYGRGFDVLNLSFAKSTLYLCGDEVANLRVKMCVLGSGLDCRITRGRPDTPDKRQATSSSRRTIFALSGDDAPLLREADPACSEISGDLAILFYLNKLYPSSLEGATATPSAAPPTVGARPVGSVGGSSGPTSTKKPNTIQHGREPSTASMRERQRLASNIFARITQANELLFLWQELRGGPLTASTRSTHQVRRLSPEQRAAELSSAAALLQLQLQQRQQPSPQQDTTSATATTTIPRTKPSVSDSTSTTATATAAASSAAASAAAAQQIASSSSSHNSSTQRSGGTGTAPAPAAPNTTRALEVEAFEGELEVWEEYAEQSEYIAGDVYAVVDCAFWPVLNEIVRRWEGWSERKYPHLADYWRKVGAMGSTRAALMVGRD